jgi:hypothetical protein
MSFVFVDASPLYVGSFRTRDRPLPLPQDILVAFLVTRIISLSFILGAIWKGEEVYRRKAKKRGDNDGRQAFDLNAVHHHLSLIRREATTHLRLLLRLLGCKVAPSRDKKKDLLYTYSGSKLASL